MQVNNFIASELPVTRIEDGACRFMMSLMSAVQKFWGEYNQYKADIDGGSASGQWGMTFYSAREALHLGIDAYLTSRGYFSLDEPLLRLRLLALDAGIDSAIHSEAYSLEFANPDTADDVRKYARRCIEFVEQRLGMHWIDDELARSTGGLKWNADSLGFHRALENIGATSNQSAKAVEMKRELLKKLAPAVYREVNSKVWCQADTSDKNNSNSARDK